MDQTLIVQALNNQLQRLKNNPYPGRIIICGMSGTEELVQVYAIMGRSQPSRNRIFVAEGGKLRTDLVNSENAGDTSLILYNAMVENGRCYSVSNGAQTDDAALSGSDSVGKISLAGLGVPSWIERWQYEPDTPNFTPRISANLLLPKDGEPYLEMSILKKSVLDMSCTHHLYRFSKLSPGFGHCITTYSGDGNPLPSFTGDPYLIALAGTAEEIATGIWADLNEDNRVSLAVKVINPKTRTSTIHIINKYQKA